MKIMKYEICNMVIIDLCMLIMNFSMINLKFSMIISRLNMFEPAQLPQKPTRNETVVKTTDKRNVACHVFRRHCRERRC